MMHVHQIVDVSFVTRVGKEPMTDGTVQAVFYIVVSVELT